MSARASIQRIARERALVDPDREICGECNGSGQGDYGPCQHCDGYGSWVTSDLHERPDDEAACLAWAEFHRSGASPSVGEAPPPPSSGPQPLPQERLLEMASNPVILPSSLTTLVADLATTRQRIAICDANPSETDDWDDLQRRRHALETRIAADVYALTGVSLETLTRVVTL